MWDLGMTSEDPRKERRKKDFVHKLEKELNEKRAECV
jgi:hypothetical protein